ncbi:MAG TPA: FAD-dependent oxidoreductase [Planctomycetes bacterium]|nr:FAD-dependent oxidoreductase [Planctomycetota bacterium]
MSGDRKVKIRLDGVWIEVKEGAQLAAALLDLGVVSLRRSATGERRGALCAMGSCHECRLVVDGHRGVRSCLIRVRDQMQVETERELDRAPLAPLEISAPQQDVANLLVIGAGPAGLAAAIAAAELGLDVLVVDESPGPGGRIWAHNDRIPAEARSWIERAERAGVRRLHGYSIIDGEPGRLQASSVASGESIEIECDTIVIATGARERFLPFPGWTLPGVVGAGALQSLIKGGLAVKGKRLVVAGTGPLLLAVAQLARQQQARVLLVEQASNFKRIPLLLRVLKSRARIRQSMALWKSLRDVEKLSCSWPVKAEGDQRVERVHLQTEKGIRIEDVDGLAVGFGLVPETRVAEGLGCRILDDGCVAVDHQQWTGVEGVYCAGEPTGIAGCEAAIDSGLVAGISAAGRTPRAHLQARVRRHRAWGAALEAAHSLRPELFHQGRGEVMLCRCEDVTAATADRIGSIREARLLCRIGMGPCQGRVCMPILEAQGEHRADSVRPPWSTSPGKGEISQ